RSSSSAACIKNKTASELLASVSCGFPVSYGERQFEVSPRNEQRSIVLHRIEMKLKPFPNYLYGLLKIIKEASGRGFFYELQE
ncbi:hypothetical protein, partial [Mogibacterium timidum]|uniref:hypothetical protein n=1 Tax=Mogibacterium timidum TaxID=35519 RepID=UPI0028D771CA